MNRSFLFLAGAVLLVTPALADRLPVSANDIAVGERFNTFPHEPGIQAQGKDIGLKRHISDSNWSALKDGKSDTTVLNNWLVYGRPVYAMHAGTVVGCWRNAPENVPGTLNPLFTAKKYAGGGNHIWILQDNGVFALYAHMQPGSIPASICPHNAKLFTGTAGPFAGNPDIDPSVKVTNGAHIAAGQKLGLIGNSGATAQGPHLHVHMEKDGQPVVMKFDHGMTTPFDNGTASFAGPWTKLAGNAMPMASILFWPPQDVGNYTFKGTPDEEYQALFDHLADLGEMPNLVWCEDNGQIYNSTWIPTKGAWFHKFGMSAAEAAAQNSAWVAKGFKRTSSYTCGDIQAAVWRK